MVFSRGFLHLYTNITARKHWCEQNREQFVLPQQQLPQQLSGGYAVPQQLSAYSMQQQLPQQQLVYAVPHQQLPGYEAGDQHGYQGAQQRSNWQDQHNQIDGREDHVYEQHHQDHGHANNGFQ